MRHAPIVRTAALLLTASAATLALTSCSGMSGDHEWSTAAEMAKAPESTSVPSLVATDATDISLRTPPFGKGDTFIAWSTKDGVTRSDCTTGALGTAPAAGDVSWWPKAAPAEGQRCGWWRVFTKDGRYYAWQQLSASKGS